MLLAVEIGNTSVAAALFDGPRCLAQWSWPTHTVQRPSDLLATALGDRCPARVAVAGVVPAAVVAWSAAAGELAPVLHVRHDHVPLRSVYQPPAALGLDRLLAAYAAREAWGAPVLVADCGTATTLEVVDAAGVYRGGAILCGLDLQRQALATGTALLPEVPWAAPDSACGTTTVSCLQIGLVTAHAAALAGLAAQVRHELGLAGAPLIGTGGLAAVVAAADRELFRACVPELVLDGLRRVAEVVG